jgi:hypothetical protein
MKTSQLTKEEKQKFADWAFGHAEKELERCVNEMVTNAESMVAELKHQKTYFDAKKDIYQKDFFNRVNEFDSIIRVARSFNDNNCDPQKISHLIGEYQKAKAVKLTLEGFSNI